MSTPMDHSDDGDVVPIVIVGAGQAAARAAQALRALGHVTGITIVGAEAHAPYERPPLSKAVLQSPEEPAVAVLPADQLHGLGLDVRLGVRATRLDTARRLIELSDGHTLKYGRCLLATGGSARVLPGLPPGTPRVHYLRTLDDARRLREALQPGTRLAIVGAGFLGLEAALSATRRGASVTLVESAPTLLARFLPPELSAWLEAQLRQNGLRLLTGRQLRGAALTGDGVHLQLDADESVVADHVLVAIGLTPETALAREAGLAIDPANGGICLGPNGQSSNPDVFAAGDCASQFHPHLGATLRLESWQNANEQAQLAAHGLLDLPPPEAPYPWFWTDQGEHNLQMLGMGRDDLTYVRRGELGASAKAVWIGHRDGVPVHGIALNAGADLRALRPLFERKVPIDIEHFASPSTNLRTWAKAALAAHATTA